MCDRGLIMFCVWFCVKRVANGQSHLLIQHISGVFNVRQQSANNHKTHKHLNWQVLWTVFERLSINSKWMWAKFSFAVVITHYFDVELLRRLSSVSFPWNHSIHWHFSLTIILILPWARLSGHEKWFWEICTWTAAVLVFVRVALRNRSKNRWSFLLFRT